jgi:hypothetical protein
MGFMDSQPTQPGVPKRRLGWYSLTVRWPFAFSTTNFDEPREDSEQAVRRVFAVA